MTPEENFFTEVFVAVLRRNEKLLREFLLRFLNISEQYKNIRIESQVNLPALPGHARGSRPDVMIKLFPEDSETYDMVLIESKIGSSEQENQLPNYADHLGVTFGNARNCFLLYITRSFDPKETQNIKTNLSQKVEFFQIRWSQFHTLLEIFRTDGLVDEMAIFMEDNGMAEVAKLIPGDIQAMESMPRLMQFMLSSLDDDVKSKYKSIVGVQPLAIKEMLENLRSSKYFMLEGYIGNDMSVSLGYSFDGRWPEYPTLALDMNVNEESAHWKKCTDAMKQFISNSSAPEIKWKTYNLDKPHSWAGVYTEIPLSSIPKDANEMSFVKDKFSFLLDQVALFKKTYRNLPWVAG